MNNYEMLGVIGCVHTADTASASPRGPTAAITRRGVALTLAGAAAVPRRVAGKASMARPTGRATSRTTTSTASSASQCLQRYDTPRSRVHAHTYTTHITMRLHASHACFQRPWHGHATMLRWSFTARHCLAAQDDHKGALREAELLSSLDHQNIISYKESFVDKDGALCIITSFCDDGDLFTKIRKKAAQKQYFNENEVMDMFLQVGRGNVGRSHACSMGPPLCACAPSWACIAPP